MSAVFSYLLSMSMNAGWLILAVLVLRLLLKRTPRRWTLLLWALVAVRLAIPFTVESAFSLIPSDAVSTPLSGGTLEIGGEELPVTWTPDAPVFNDTPDITPDTDLDTLETPVIPPVSGTTPDVPTVTDPATQPTDVTAIVYRVAGWLWLGGVAVMLAVTLFQYASLRRKLATSVPLQAGVYLSDQVASPFVLGLLRPRIYLPFGAENKEETPYILAHERSHIRAGDPWWKLLGWCLLAVYWFHPLVWAAYLLLGRDLEQACDERVLRELGEESRGDYSRALVAHASRSGTALLQPLAFGASDIKNRVKHILRYRRPTVWVTVIALLLCVVCGACFMTDPKREEAATGDGTLPITSADLDHDGKAETLKLEIIEDTKQYDLSVIDEDGTSLWTGTLHDSHAGEGSLLLCQKDGKDYLLDYDPHYGMGYFRAEYVLFYLKNGEKTVVETKTLSCELTPNPPDPFPLEEMVEFQKTINALLKDSTLLFSTNDTVRLLLADETPYDDFSHLYEYVSFYTEYTGIDAERSLKENVESWLVHMRERQNSKMQYLPLDFTKDDAYTKAVIAYDQFLQGELGVYSDVYGVNEWESFWITDMKTGGLEPGVDQYALLDINGDGIPELHTRSYVYDIFTYQNDTVKHLCSTPAIHMGDAYVLENGALLSYQNTTGTTYQYYTVDSEGNTTAITFFDGEGTTGEVSNERFMFQNKDVSKDEFKELTKAFLSYKKTKLAWYAYTTK